MYVFDGGLKLVELVASPKSQTVDEIVVPAAAVLKLVNVKELPAKHCIAFEMVKLGVGEGKLDTVTA